MLIDTEHLHHWMRAIRNSENPIRTMDAFWRGQILSKEWLIDELIKQQHHFKSQPDINIFGGWVGTLSSLLFQSELSVSHINSIDIDPDCQEIASTMNQIELEAGRFRAITADMCEYQNDCDIAINTSFEHITQDQYKLWLGNLSADCLIVLQSNDYKIPEHVRIATDLENFKKQSDLKTILYAGELETSLYKRFMIIGKKI